MGNSCLSTPSATAGKLEELPMRRFRAPALRPLAGSQGERLLRMSESGAPNATNSRAR